MGDLPRKSSRSRLVFLISKFCVTLVSVCLFVLGFVMFGIALWTLSEGRGFFRNGLYMASSIITLLLSVVVLSLSAVGFFGARRRVRSFVLIFICFLALVLLVIIAVVVMAWLFKDGLSNAQMTLRNELYSSVRDYFDDGFVQE